MSVCINNVLLLLILNGGLCPGLVPILTTDIAAVGITGATTIEVTAIATEIVRGIGREKEIGRGKETERR